MSKILKNQTMSPINISDTGVTVPVLPSTYTIPPQDYLLWASSSDIVTHIGNGNIVVNDGSSDLDISYGVDLIKGLFPKNIEISQDINKSVKVDLFKSAFGEMLTSSLNPYINIKATKGLTERTIETYTNGTGSFAGVHDHAPGREFEVECGTSTGGYGVLRSKKTLEYQGGVGNLARFTAKFSTPAANTTMRAGLLNIGNELGFGYNGTQFGIIYRTGGRPEIRTLTITQRATTSQTATVTLNGVAFNVAVTNSSIEQNAYEIATNVSYTGWNAYNVGSTVVFQSRSTGAKSSTYSISSTGNLTGNIVQTSAGLTETDTWIYQNSWNIDKLLTSDDSFILDHTKGNVYQIQYQYLGYGAITFYIEEPTSGAFIPVHRIRYANANTSPSLDMPDFKLGIIAYNLGSGTSVGVASASMSAFNENEKSFPGKTHSAINAASGINTTLTSVATFKKVTFSDNVLNLSDIKALQLSFAAEATNPVILEVRLNPTISGVQKWESLDEDVALVLDRSQNTISGGELIYTIATSKSSNTIVDLVDLDIVLSNDDVISLAVRATNGTVAATVGFVWGD